MSGGADAPDGEHIRRFEDAMRQMTPIVVVAGRPAAAVEPVQCCGVCRFADPATELCRWAERNPLPPTLPFWMLRPALVYVDADEGHDCGGFEPRPAAEGGR